MELVKRYHNQEYSMISITDHDGFEGVKEAQIAGEALEMKVVPGVEITTSYSFLPESGEIQMDEIKTELHILGYYFDLNNSDLNEKLMKLRESRKQRNIRLVEKLNELGYKVDLKHLESLSKGGYVGKPNIARELVRLGYINEEKEAFESERIYKSPEIENIKRSRPDTVDIINLLKQAGGIAVLAHPGKIKELGEIDSQQYWNNIDCLIGQLKKCGLKGLECFHPSHTHEQALEFAQLAGKYHLHILEGSDFHG